MHDKPLFFLVVVTVAAVALILMLGIGSFARGGEFNRRNANKIMRWRLIAQAVAIAAIMIYVSVAHR